MVLIKRFYFIPLVLLILVLAIYSYSMKSWGAPNMTELTTRLQPIFEKNKTVCFGRFVIDVPSSVKVVWGQALVPYDVNIYPNGIDEVEGEAQKFIQELKNEKAIYHDDVPLLLSVDNTKDPEGKLVIGYEGFEAINGLKINSYFRLNNDGVVLNARPLGEDKDSAIADLLSMAKRLRQRTVDEVPSEPGNCIEHAFLADKPNPSEEDLLEHIRIGFRFKEFPDAHFSIYVAPANTYNPEQDSLETQMKRTKDDMTSVSERIVLARTKFFRESNRQIHDWHTGYEVLMRSPDEDGSLSHHDFELRFIGMPRDPYRPYAKISFETGVANNAAGATKASLTDEEAIAIWDRLTSSIRVRPTKATVKTSEAETQQKHPIGELAATGRTCPQTGWWEPDDQVHRAGERRQHIKAGERMPHVVSRGEPSIWQKLKGEQPTYRTATTWKLVSYDTGPAIATNAPEPLAPESSPPTQQG